MSYTTKLKYFAMRYMPMMFIHYRSVIFLCLCFCAACLSAQKPALVLSKSPIQCFRFEQAKTSCDLRLLIAGSKNSAWPAPPPLSVVPRWEAGELPFFCKVEHQWGKKMALPVKFRLGSVQYVDALEGKGKSPH